tara:strand:+ start:50129 stop:51100 length:972 start_codon:yes stop_codon:yes gene_type:complete
MNLITNKKVLVTGGAGFIGSHLCDELIRLGNTVVCLDNFYNGSVKNIEHLINHDKFKVITGDIRNVYDCHDATIGVEIVFHNAALGSVPRSFSNPTETNEVNISGFLNILEASKQNGVERFIYAASSSTYGDHPALPKVEDVIGNPLSPYAITKYVNELYANLSDLDTVGLRYFNVFGERQSVIKPYSAVIPTMIYDGIGSGVITVNGDGETSRDFTYVQNVVNMNILSASTNNRNALNQIYNVGCNNSITLNTLSSIIRNYFSMLDEYVKINHVNSRIGDIRHSLASIDKANDLLGYHPHYSIMYGMERTFNYYYNKYNGKI